MFGIGVGVPGFWGNSAGLGVSPDPAMLLGIHAPSTAHLNLTLPTFPMPRLEGVGHPGSGSNVRELWVF